MILEGASLEVRSLQRKSIEAGKGNYDPKSLIDLQDRFNYKYLSWTGLPDDCTRFISTLALYYPGSPKPLEEGLNDIADLYPGQNSKQQLIRLNRFLKESLGLKIHTIKKDGETKGLFLGGPTWFDARGQDRMRLLVAGYTEKEVAQGVGLRAPTIKNWLSDQYRWLGADNVLEAAIMLVQNNQVDMTLFEQRVDINQFASITKMQRRILTTIINQGLTLDATAKALNLHGSTVRNNVGFVKDRISENDISPVTVRLAFWLFLQREQGQSLVRDNDLSYRNSMAE